ncbi:MAG: sugar phosphate nucleotidyltransferase [Halobacteria archaeon]
MLCTLRMKAVVLAAGEGTRLRPRTETIPKPLVEVNGKPILSHCFDSLLETGITDAVVVVGYRKSDIVGRYDDSYRGMDLEYVEQEARKGLAHAVLTAECKIDSDFVVVNGDNVYRGNLPEAVTVHRSSDAEITMLVEEVSRDEAKLGAVCETDESVEVTGIVEKPDDPPSKIAPAAFYVLPPETFAACKVIKPSERGEYELPDAIDLLIHAGFRTRLLHFEGWKVNVNNEEDVETAETKLRDVGSEGLGNKN